MKPANVRMHRLLDDIPEAILLLADGPNRAASSDSDGHTLRVTYANRRASALLPPLGAEPVPFASIFASPVEWERFLLVFRLWRHVTENGDWCDFQGGFQTLFQEYRCLEGAQCDLRFQWLTHGNTEFWADLSLGRAAADDAPGRILCSFRDISHQVVQEQRLRDRHRSFIQSQELVHLGSWEMSADGQEMWCSDEFYKIFGLAPRSMRPSMENFLARVHPEDQEKMRGAMSTALASNGHYRLEHRIVRPDGSVRTVCGQGILERDANGEPVGMYGTLQDTTERRLAEDNLAIARKVFEHAIEGVIVTDAAGVILSTNQAFTDITGYTADEVIGKKPNILRSERHDKAFYTAMWATLLATNHWSGEVWNRRKGGEAYLQHLNINGLLDAEGQVTRYICVFHDLTQMKRNEENLNFQENHDALTGLVNRSLLNDLLGQTLGYAQHDGSHVAVLMVGLDRFKHVNESLGHACGDILLFNMAWRLSALVGENDIVSRFGGDIFVIVCPALRAGVQETAALTRKLQQAMSTPFDIEGHELFITASIGVALAPDDGTDTTELLRNAELAMYRAKSQGRDTCEYYAAEMNKAASLRFSLEADLRRAIENDEFEVFYQPKFHSDRKSVIGMEALVRWRHPTKGMIPPADFIPLAEETGMIVAIGEQVLRQACWQTRLWRDMGYDLTVAVNLSARQFRLKNLIIQIQDILAGAGLRPEMLELEITESAVMNDVEEAIAVLQRMSEAGLKISMDDFGTGYSSLSYLKRFPIDKLKIDQSFVRDMHTNVEDASIVTSIISLARNLKIGVVAEGVELETQMDMLSGLGCDEIQGYFVSRPLPASAFSAFLAQSRPEVSDPSV